MHLILLSIFRSHVSATALFYCAYPVANASKPPTVHAFNFDYPIIDFTLAPDNSTWILLDTSTTTDTDASEDRPSPVALLSWASGKVSTLFLPPTHPRLTHSPAIASRRRRRARPAQVSTISMHPARYPRRSQSARSLRPALLPAEERRPRARPSPAGLSRRHRARRRLFYQ